MKLSIALFTSLSTTCVFASTNTEERELQFDETVQCFATVVAGTGTVADCCPAGKDHPICSLIVCADLDLTQNAVGVQDECTCSDLTQFCSSELPSLVGALVEGLDGTCDSVKDCCTDGVENDAFKSCTMTYLAEKGDQVPDMSTWIPEDADITALLPGIGPVIPESENQTILGVVGADYCTYSFDYDCYPDDGKPSCCLVDDEECPTEKPPCATNSNSTTVDPTSNMTEMDSETATATPDDAPEEPSAPSSANIIIGFLWSGVALLAGVTMQCQI